jgi:hypothetical protein
MVDHLGVGLSEEDEVVGELRRMAVGPGAAHKRPDAPTEVVDARLLPGMLHPGEEADLTPLDINPDLLVSGQVARLQTGRIDP